MWIVFRLAGRHAGVQLPGPRGPGPRARGAHRGKLGQRRPAASDPGSLPRSRRGAVRLLHAGIRGGGRRPVGERREPKPGYRARGDQRQPRPVYGLPEDPRRGRPGGHTPASRRMILLDGCRVVVTMDDAGTELENGSILIDGGAISWVGQGRPPVREQPDVIDGRGLVAVPGLINTHHHLYQTLTRVHAQQRGLFDWLRELYPIWATIDDDWERTAAEVGLAELALSGCSTTTDHHYVFPSGVTGLPNAEIDVAEQLGLRFHPCRGSMDLGQSSGGAAPGSGGGDIHAHLVATDQAIQQFPHPAPGSMRRIALGPPSPF